MNAQPDNHLREWLQTFVSILAVVAAVGIAIYQQSRNDRRAAADRHRKFVAIRAALPITLAEISNYVFEVIRLLKIHVPSPGGSVIIAGNPNVPHLPSSAIDQLKELVEYSPNDVGTPAASLMQFMQIHNSRLSNAFNQISPLAISEWRHQSLLYDSVYLMALNDQFFAFSRGTEESIDAQITREEARRAARIVDVEGIDTLIDVRLDRERRPEKLFFRRAPPRS